MVVLILVSLFNFIDYFYFKEHLFLVCELLRDNLYEYSKYNRQNDSELYFNVARLQKITHQLLTALHFVHSLGIIHCDLKPENILIKSYSRVEVKLIDFGSSCFTTDQLCSYVQSRTYRAPEVRFLFILIILQVILGLPYDQRIDMWSIGCILVELFTGHVLFANTSIQRMLAKVIGICGELDRDMLQKGRYTRKFFTPNSFQLYERNRQQKKGQPIAYFLKPKRSALKHRLHTNDAEFFDFIAKCLQTNPANRMTSADALKHAWLSKNYDL